MTAQPDSRDIWCAVEEQYTLHHCHSEFLIALFSGQVSLVSSQLRFVRFYHKI